MFDFTKLTDLQADASKFIANAETLLTGVAAGHGNVVETVVALATRIGNLEAALSEVGAMVRDVHEMLAADKVVKAVDAVLVAAVPHPSVPDVSVVTGATQYTPQVSTEQAQAVAADPFAPKPLVVAEVPAGQ